MKIFDEVILKDKRILLVSCLDIFYIGDARNHCLKARLKISARAKPVAETFFKRAGFSYVDDAPLAVAHEIDAWLWGYTGQFFFDVHGLRSGTGLPRPHTRPRNDKLLDEGMQKF
jgi:hypothetical protein